MWRDIPEQWLCAAGRREAGDPDDLYASLAQRGRTGRAEYSASNRPVLTTDTWIKPLLPQDLDHKRLVLEGARGPRRSGPDPMNK